MAKKQSVFGKIFGKKTVQKRAKKKPEKLTENMPLAGNAPAVIEPPPLPVVKPEKVLNYLDVMGLTSKLDENEKKLFVTIAVESGLNPFMREIYCIPYGQGQNRKLSIVTGYEVYIKRATRSMLLNGWNVEFEGEGNNLVATITIHRKDWEKPLVHPVEFSEYAQTTWRDGKQVLTKFWKDKPKTMLRKVAISQGFRLAFPVELGGMPYTADELPDNMNGRGEKNVTPPPPDKKKEKSAAKKSNGPDVVIEVSPELEEMRINVRNKFIMIKKYMPVKQRNQIIAKMEEAKDDVKRLKLVLDFLQTLKEEYKAVEAKAEEKAEEIVKKTFDGIIEEEIKRIKEDIY